MKAPKGLEMADLKRYEYQNGRYVCVQTHVFNKPWAIVKDAQKKLEAQKWPPKTYFKPEAVIDPTKRTLKQTSYEQSTNITQI